MSRPHKRFLRRMALTILAALVLLIAVLGINAARFPSRQIVIEPIEPRRIDEQASIDRLQRSLAIETISPNQPEPIDPEPFEAFKKFLAAEFPLVHSKLEKIDIPGHSLLFRWPGSKPEANPILLMGHYDVVPVEPRTEGQWTHPPFSGHLDDEGWIWGRGALDVKPAVLGWLEACELLLAENQFKPACDLYFSFGHDEELGGSEGAVRIAALLRERLESSGRKLQFVLDEGGAIIDGLIPGMDKPVAYVAVAEKGFATIELVATHAGGHSSTPPRETAVSILAEAIAKLHGDPFPTRLEGATGQMLDFAGPEMPLGPRVAIANRWLFAPLIERQFASSPATAAVVRTTTAATMIDGGVKDNVLPTRAEAKINFRILPGETRDTVLARVKAIVAHPSVSYRLMPMSSDPSAVTRSDTAEFRLLQRTVGEIFPGVLVSPGLSVGATDSRHFESIALSTFRFVPMRVTSGDVARIHGIDERIAAKNYLEIVRFYVRLLENAASEEAVVGR